MLQKCLDVNNEVSRLRFSGVKGENHEALWVTSRERLLRNSKPL